MFDIGNLINWIILYFTVGTAFVVVSIVTRWEDIRPAIQDFGDVCFFILAWLLAILIWPFMWWMYITR